MMIRIRYLCPGSLGALVVAAAKEQREACCRAQEEIGKAKKGARAKSVRCALQGPAISAERETQKKMAAPVHPAPPFDILPG